MHFFHVFSIFHTQPTCGRVWKITKSWVNGLVWSVEMAKVKMSKITNFLMLGLFVFLLYIMAAMLQTVRKWTQINQWQLGNHLGSISGVIDPFRGLWTAPKTDSGHSGADFDLPWHPLPTPPNFHIILHISSLTRTYWGHFRPSKVSFSAIAEMSSLLLRQCEFWKYCF